MRYILMIAMMGLSTSAFAGFQVYENNGLNMGDKEFSCKFRGEKKGLRCWAKVEIDKDKAPELNATEKRAKLKIECTNGFDLFDKYADVDYDDGVLKIKGRDDGHKAILAIKFDDLRQLEQGIELSDRDFKAWLKLENRVEVTLRGRCEKERDLNLQF